MKFSYIQNQYDEITADILDSTLCINATIIIRSEEVHSESLHQFVQDSVDGRMTESIQKQYPKYLNKYYRIKVFPSERTLNRNEKYKSQSGLAGDYEPFDRWVSCFVTDVDIGNNDTYFDKAKFVQIQGINYDIKAIVKENFSINCPVVHVFLIKDTTE